MATDELAFPDKVKVVARQLATDYLTSSRRAETNKLYSTFEDFTRADPTRKRLVAIGLTGAGKSTLLNVIAGWRFVQSKETDYKFVWKRGDAAAAVEEEPLFKAAAGTDATTQVAAFANVDFRGDSSRPLTIVDTPGHDDPKGNDIGSQEARDALGKLAADLHDKLKALGHVHAILVLHNDVIGNKLNPATYALLKMVDEKFQRAGQSVWEHVVIGYSKCNAFETSWRGGLKDKSAALQKAIRDQISGCNVDVPVLPLGGGEIEPPPPSQDEADGLEQLYAFVDAAEPLETSDLQPFEGADVKFQKLIDEKNEAEARAKAAIIYVAVMIKLIVVCSSLFARHHFLPSALSLLLLNLPGIYDEVLILGLFVYWVGPKDVFYSLKHFSKQWVMPKLEPYLVDYLGMGEKPKAD